MVIVINIIIFRIADNIAVESNSAKIIVIVTTIMPIVVVILVLFLVI